MPFLPYQIGKNPEVAEPPSEAVRTRATGNGGPGDGVGWTLGALPQSIGASASFFWG